MIQNKRLYFTRGTEQKLNTGLKVIFFALYNNNVGLSRGDRIVEATFNSEVTIIKPRFHCNNAVSSPLDVLVSGFEEKN